MPQVQWRGTNGIAVVADFPVQLDITGTHQLNQATVEATSAKLVTGQVVQVAAVTQLL